MDFESRNRAPGRDAGQQTVRAETLKEALQKVRRRYGAEAAIVESRTVSLRQDDGLGQQRLVEVVVETEPKKRSLASTKAAARRPGPLGTADRVTGSILMGVQRIEKIIDDLAAEKRDIAERCELRTYPLAAALLDKGTSPKTVRRLADSFAAECPAADATMPAAREHLRKRLRGGSADWNEIAGCHVFLGEAGVGKTDLVLGLAARLTGAGRKVLVLNLLPRHGGDVRRLQIEAAEYGYDAGVLRGAKQLYAAVQHVTTYDVVLIDTPALFGPGFADLGDLHDFISQNESFHRHLLVPLDRDLNDAGDLWESGRIWNCDWLAVTRLDRCRKFGKLLDLAAYLPRPVAFCTSGGWPGRQPELFVAETGIELVLGRQQELSSGAEA